MSAQTYCAVPPRFGAAAALAGAALLMLSTLIHPMAADPSDAVAAFTEYAADKRWITSHLGQFFGVALLFIGLTSFADTIGKSSCAWLTRIGIYFGVAAVAGAAVLQAVDGVALKGMVDIWANSPADQKQSALSATLAVRHIEVGAAAITAISGAAIGSARNPIWLIWLGLAGGLGTFAAGITTAFTGFSATTMAIGMPADLIVITWISIVGVLMWRQAA